MENATDCYTIIKIPPQDASLCGVKMPFQELPKAFGGHEEGIYFLLERNLNGVDIAASFNSPSSSSLVKLPWRPGSISARVQTLFKGQRLLCWLVEKHHKERQAHSPEFPKIQQVRIAM